MVDTIESVLLRIPPPSSLLLSSPFLFPPSISSLSPPLTSISHQRYMAYMSLPPSPVCYSLCLMLSQYCWYVHLCKRLLRSVIYHFTYNSVKISQVRLKFQPKVPFLLREDPINLNPVTLHSFIHSFTSFYILYLQCCHSRSGEDSTMSQPSTSDRLVCFNCNIDF